MARSPRVFGSRGSFDMFRKALDIIRSFPGSFFPPAPIIIPKTVLPFIIMYFTPTFHVFPSKFSFQIENKLEKKIKLSKKYFWIFKKVEFWENAYFFEIKPK